MVAFSHQARKWAARGIAVASMLWLAACAPGLMATGEGPSVDASRAVPVALLVPGGSGSAGDAALARSLENAARMAISDLDGARIDLSVYDTAGDPARAAAVAGQAVDEGAKVILGPVFAESANAAGRAVAGRGINVLSFSNNADVAGGNVFILGPTFGDKARRLAGFAADRGKGRILIVNAESPSERVGRDAVRRALAATPGASLAGIASFPLSQQGVTDAAPRIARKAEDSGADAIFLTSTADGALPFLAQLLPENGLGPDAVQYIGLGRWDTPPQTRSLTGLQGGWFTLPPPDRVERFNRRYGDAYGEPPTPIAGLAFDAVAAVGALLAEGRSDALTRPALTQGSGFAGVNGAFRLRPDGTNERALAVATLRDNQVTVIDPAPRSFAGAGF